MNFARFSKISLEDSKNKAKIPIFDIEHLIAPLSVLLKKMGFFQKNKLGIGQSWQIGQKWILEPFYSKI